MTHQLMVGNTLVHSQNLNVAMILVLRTVIIVLQNCTFVCFPPQITKRIQKMHKPFYFFFTDEANGSWGVSNV